MGAVSLRKTGKSQDAIAALIGVSQVSVYKWLSGETKPAPAKRLQLKAEFGIEPRSWDEAPTNFPKIKSEPNPVIASIMEDPPVIPKPITIDNMNAGAMLKWRALVAFEQAEEAKDDPSLGLLEKGKLGQASSVMLVDVLKLTGEYDMDKNFFKLPIWRKVLAALRESLVGDEKAINKVIGTLEKLVYSHG